jgi:hypothetical protein
MNSQTSISTGIFAYSYSFAHNPGEWATVEMDGEVWAHSSALATNHGARFDLPIRAEEVPVNAQLVACLALNEGSAKNEEVTTLLNTLAKCVREVVKLFLPFLG